MANAGGVTRAPRASEFKGSEERLDDHRTRQPSTAKRHDDGYRAATPSTTDEPNQLIDPDGAQRITDPRPPVPSRPSRTPSDGYRYVHASLVDAHGSTLCGSFVVPRGVVVVTPPAGYWISNAFASAFRERVLAAGRKSCNPDGSVDVSRLRRRMARWIAKQATVWHPPVTGAAMPWRSDRLLREQLRECVMGPGERSNDYALTDSNRREDGFSSYVTLLDDIGGRDPGCAPMPNMPRSLSAVVRHRGRHGGGIVAMIACTFRGEGPPELHLSDPAEHDRSRRSRGRRT